MRNIFSLLMLVAALVAVTYAGRHRPQTPTFPGTPPFNPHQPNPWGKPVRFNHRFRRSNDDKNRITVEAEKNRGGSSYNVEYGRKIYENKHGSVSLNGGLSKEPQGRPQKHIGIHGEWRF